MKLALEIIGVTVGIGVVGLVGFIIGMVVFDRALSNSFNPWRR